ncbi:hypothetical protein WJX81_006630 [Elliptochloris bilobata]|uniref:RING-type E3 ubiquitin transferase n=1 Tax=Elliptochloris bilobata TaxID=381761 RepID=A0AAW1SCU3_9CHLO
MSSDGTLNWGELHDRGLAVDAVDARWLTIHRVSHTVLSVSWGAAAADKAGAGDWLLDIDLSTLEDQTRCAVCLGIVKGSRLVSGCMHRFCALCIEKWLRMTKDNTCPQCREPMQSRRDCKHDARMDRLLRVLYGDILEYEEQVFEPDAAVMRDAMRKGEALRAAAEQQRISARRATRVPPVALASPGFGSPSGGTKRGVAQRQPSGGLQSGLPAAKRAKHMASPAQRPPPGQLENGHAGAARAVAVEAEERALALAEPQTEREAMAAAQGLADKAAAATAQEAESIVPLVQVRLQAMEGEDRPADAQPLPDLPFVTCPALTSVAKLRALVCHLLQRERPGGDVDPGRICLYIVVKVAPREVRRAKDEETVAALAACAHDRADEVVLLFSCLSVEGEDGIVK